MSAIVVGVDGSKGSVKALKFAFEEARIRGTAVKAVTVWHVPPLTYAAAMPGAAIDPTDYSSLARQSLDKSLEDAGAAAAKVVVTTLVREGQPADVLCAEAQGADLLVLGSRGLGGFRGLMLGSVSQQCVHHGPCPVVTIPEDAPIEAAA